MNRVLPYLLLSITTVLLLFTLDGCQKKIEEVTPGTSSSTTPVVPDDGFATNTRDTTFANAVLIKFDGTTANITNSMSSQGVTVTANGGDVVIKSTNTTTEMNYVLSGRTTNGSVKIYGDYKFNLVLNGVSIINDDAPAINIQSSKKVSVRLQTGTRNRLIDGAKYATSTEDQKGTFFSEGSLTFGGTGMLTVTGNTKHGIASDDYVAVSQGEITVEKAASDAIHANDYVKQDGGKLTLTATGNGVECSDGYIAVNAGTLIINSVDDALSASYEGTDATITPYVQINGGLIDIKTTGDKGNGIKTTGYATVNSNDPLTISVAGKAAKGIKTAGNFTYTKGNTTISTSGSAFLEGTEIVAASGVNCDKDFVMTAGTLTINSTGAGGKGVSVDGTTTINGGTLMITTAGVIFKSGTLSSEAKGIKSDGVLTINGGTVEVSSADDGLKSNAALVINNGKVTISKSVEGIESPAITIKNGTVNVSASDDCLNNTLGTGGERNDGGTLTISGGTISLNSTKGDPLDSNGNINMTGGTVVVQGPQSSPEVAIDYNGAFNISGGVLIASGPSGNMIQSTSSTSTQNTILIRITGNVTANSLINVQNASGTSLLTFAPARTAYYFVFSSPELASGTTYTVYTGGSYSTNTSQNGLYTGGTYTNGTKKGTFTITAKTNTVTL